MKYLVFILIVVALTSAVSALEVPAYEDRYVNDFAHVLDSEDAETLSAMFSIVEQNTTAQVVFVSMDTIESEDLSSFAVAIGEKWGVGQADKDNGLVILYVKDRGKIWVSTGYGVEGIMPDSKIGRLLDENYVPLRDEGKISEGIVSFSFALSEELVMHGEELISNQGGRKTSKAQIIFIVLFIILMIYLFSKAPRSRGVWPIFIPIRTGGGHSYGGGGGGFGGGSFGGGGAGR